MAADAKLQVTISLKDELSRGIAQAREKLERDFMGTLRKTGLALSAFGAAGTVMGVKMLNAAEDSQRSIRQLDVALQNINTTYAAHTREIETVVAAQMRKTNYGDEEQRNSLQQLVQITGNYSLSLKALPAALDLAAAKGMDLESASVLVGKALIGNTEMLKRYGVNLSEGATATQVLTELTAKFGGQAQAAANPLTQMKNQFGELAESLGNALLPTFQKIVAVITNVIEWFNALPGPVKASVAIIGALTVAFATIVGPMLLFIGTIPQMVAGITALRLALGSLVGVGATGGLVSGIGAATGATGLFAGALGVLTGPVGMLAMLAAGLGVAALSYHSYKDSVDKATSSVQYFANANTKLTTSGATGIGSNNPADIAATKAELDRINAQIQKQTTDAKGYMISLVDTALDENLRLAKEEAKAVRKTADAILQHMQMIGASVEGQRQLAYDLAQDTAQAGIDAWEAWKKACADALEAQADATAAAAQAEEDWAETIREMWRRIYAQEIKDAQDAAAAKIKAAFEAAKAIAAFNASSSGYNYMTTGIMVNGVAAGGGFGLGWINKVTNGDYVGAAAAENARIRGTTNNMPEYEYGGVVPGPVGKPQVAVVHGGETFLSASGGGPVIRNIVVLDGRVIADYLGRASLSSEQTRSS